MERIKSLGFNCFLGVFCAILLQCSIAVASEKVQPGNSFIPKNTELKFELLTDLDSTQNKVGDTVQVRLLNDVFTSGGNLLLSADTELSGVLKKVQPGNYAAQSAVIRITLDDYMTNAGILLKLGRQDIKFKGDYNYTSAAAGIIIPFSGMLFKGKEVRCPAGTEFTYKLEHDYDLGVTEDFFS